MYFSPLSGIHVRARKDSGGRGVGGRSPGQDPPQMQWGLPVCRPESWGLGGCWEGGGQGEGGDSWQIVRRPRPSRGLIHKGDPPEDVPGLVTSGLESLSLSGGVGKVDPVAAKH